VLIGKPLSPSKLKKTVTVLFFTEAMALDLTASPMLVEYTADGVSLAAIGRARTGDLAAFGELVWICRRRTMGTVRRLIPRKRPRRRGVFMAGLEQREVDSATASAGWQALRDEQDRARNIDYVDSLLAHLAPSDRIPIVMREVEG
jgi:hypothetical protein